VWAASVISAQELRNARVREKNRQVQDRSTGLAESGIVQRNRRKVRSLPQRRECATL